MLAVHDVSEADYKVLLEFYDGTSREVIVKAFSRGDAATKAMKTNRTPNLKRVTPREATS